MQKLSRSSAERKWPRRPSYKGDTCMSQHLSSRPRDRDGRGRRKSLSWRGPKWNNVFRAWENRWTNELSCGCLPQGILAEWEGGHEPPSPTGEQLTAGGFWKMEEPVFCHRVAPVEWPTFQWIATYVSVSSTDWTKWIFLKKKRKWD